MKDNYFGLEVHTHLTAILSDIAEAIFFSCYLIFNATKGVFWGSVSIPELKNSQVIYSLSPNSHILDIYGNSLCHSHLPE